MAAVKFGSHLKEIRILMCQKSKSSEGVRNFIQQHYVNLKKNNPTVPVLIRECSHIEPVLFARYEYGKERRVPLQNLPCEEVAGKVQQVASQKS